MKSSRILVEKVFKEHRAYDELEECKEHIKSVVKWTVLLCFCAFVLLCLFGLK